MEYSLTSIFPFGIFEESNRTIRFIIDVHPPYIKWWADSNTDFSLDKEAGEYLKQKLANYKQPQKW